MIFKIKHYLIFVSVILLIGFSSCRNAEVQHSSGFIIKGKIKHSSPVKSISIHELTPTGFIFLDSSNIESDGSFMLNGTLSEKTFCTIRFEKGDIVLLVDSNSNFTLDIDASDIDNYTLNGSEEAKEMKELTAINSKYFKMGQDISKKYDNVKIYDLKDHLCDKSLCYAKIEGHILYSDHHHLGKNGNILLKNTGINLPLN